MVKFANVPTAQLGAIKPRFFEVIKRLVAADGIDMKRMHSVIHNSKVSVRTCLLLCIFLLGVICIFPLMIWCTRLLCCAYSP